MEEMIMKNNHSCRSHQEVTCAVITVSDTRDKDTDKSGSLMIDLLTKSKHQVNVYEVIPDEKKVSQQTIKAVIHNKGIEAVSVTGATGVAHREVTIETIEPLFHKELQGFDELFRLLSYQLDIGSASMLSRAIAWVANNRMIFLTPGSTGAVKLAMNKLILPELGHVVTELSKDLP